MFSHGLLGGIEMYSQICVEMASYGAVVISLEHEDKSAARARDADGNIIPYETRTSAASRKNTN